MSRTQYQYVAVLQNFVVSLLFSLEAASREKNRIEEKQRETRKLMKKKKDEFNPRSATSHQFSPSLCSSMLVFVQLGV